MSTANFSVLDACQHRPWHYLIEPVENAQSRRELMSLSDRELSDIGLERTYATGGEPTGLHLACPYATRDTRRTAAIEVFAEVPRT